MSRYASILRDIEGMQAAFQAAAALTSLQQKLLDALGTHKGDLLTDLAKKPEFRGVHFAKMMSAAEALHKKGLVTFDGKMVTNQSFPPTPMQATVRAAKDIGDAKNDKKRKATITDLVKRATGLAEGTEAAGFPEVGEAVKTVMALSEFIGRMDTASARLKAAPAGSLESVEAQKLIDALRVSADTMIPPLTATLETLENLVDVASEMEAQFSALSDQVKVMDEKLKKEKARLAAASNAVQNAVKLA
jgi:hypothetical protein